MRLHLLRAATRGFSWRRGSRVLGRSLHFWCEYGPAAEDPGAGTAAFGGGGLFDGADAFQDQSGKGAIGEVLEALGSGRRSSETTSGMGPSSRKKCLGREATRGLRWIRALERRKPPANGEPSRPGRP